MQGAALPHSRLAVTAAAKTPTAVERKSDLFAEDFIAFLFSRHADDEYTGQIRENQEESQRILFSGEVNLLSRYLFCHKSHSNEEFPVIIQAAKDGLSAFESLLHYASYRFYFTMQDVFVQLFYNRIVSRLYLMFLGNNDIFISR